MKTLVEQVLSYGETIPDKPAVCFKDTAVSYGELRGRIRGIAVALRGMGIKRGDRVMLSAVSKPEMAALYLGIQYIGAVVVFVDKNATPENVIFLYEDTEAVLFLTDRRNQVVEEKCRTCSAKNLFQRVECDPGHGNDDAKYVMPKEEEIAEIIYTSGTTGKPKGAMLTYRAVYHIWKNTVDGTPMESNDIVLLPLPLNHSFALRVFRAALALGATVVLQNGFTFAKEIENNMERYGCTAIAIVPASVETISRQMQEQFAKIMGRFRYIEVSAGSLSVEQRKRLCRELPTVEIHNTWGSTETGGALFLNVREALTVPGREAAIGKPLDGIQIRTLAEDGTETAGDRAQPGRMALKGNMQMSGYWHRPEETAQSIRDGWLITGDMVYTDADGFVYMLGRADDIINVGGEKVSPVEVENIAGEYAGIAECACIGVPDPEKVLGFIPAMYYVVSGEGFRLEDFKEYLHTRLEKYKVPQEFIQVAELPRNSMKKVDRRSLRSLWDSHGRESLINPVVQTILTRRSIRKFTDQQIPEEILEVLIKAGYHAPSGHNMQTWKFTVVQTPETIAHIRDVMEKTARENGVYFYGFENPVCLILVSNDKRNQDGCQDASCAAENIMLAAHSYGLGSVWINALMKLRDAEPAKTMLDELHIPETHIVWSTIALGYPTAEGVLLAKNADVVEWL